MDINEKINLINFAERKAAGAETPKDKAAAQGYAQALVHAKIITSAKYHELLDIADKAHKAVKARANQIREGK